MTHALSLETHMKSSSFFQSVMVIAATLFLLWAALGCTSSTSSDGVTPIGIPSKFASQTNEFAFEFFKTLNNETAQKSKNVFVSPLSLHTALGYC